MPALDGPGLIIVFVAAAIATWIAGLYLSRATDALDVRLGLGEALGGMILLAVAGSLPELAITVSAVAEGELGIAAGNLIGGIAMQTLVLVICDRVVRGRASAELPGRLPHPGARRAPGDRRRRRDAHGHDAAIDDRGRAVQPGLHRNRRRLGGRDLHPQPCPER